MTEIIFEIFSIPGMYVCGHPDYVAPAYAPGHTCTTGMVFDSGDGVSDAVTIYEGYTLPRACHSSLGSGQM